MSYRSSSNRTILAHTRVCPDSVLQRKIGAPHGASPNHRLRALSLLARFLDMGEQYINMVRRVPVPIPNPLPQTVRPSDRWRRDQKARESRDRAVAPVTSSQSRICHAFSLSQV